jgi:hypothetical protein
VGGVVELVLGEAGVAVDVELGGFAVPVASHCRVCPAPKGTLIGMNRPEEVTPEYAQQLLGVVSMMNDLGRQSLGFLVGYMASKDIDLALEAFGALMSAELPEDP